jgi:glycosyltransferase involved in cell wall biosynthesis
MDTVSIVVPTYNQARYLPVCLDSLWFQDYPALEIVVVDDGSPDETRAVLDAYQAAVAGERTSFAANYDAATDTVERTWHARYPAAAGAWCSCAMGPTRASAPRSTRVLGRPPGGFARFSPRTTCCCPPWCPI